MNHAREDVISGARHRKVVYFMDANGFDRYDLIFTANKERFT